MNSEWREVTLGDVLNFRRGHDLPKTKMKEGYVPVMGSNGIIGYHNEWTTLAPCISIGRSGNVGKPKILFQNCWAHNTTLYVDDFKGNYPRFLYYFLQKLNLSSFRGGSAVPTLNRNHIHPIPVSIPPLPEQKAIAHILGTLDDKIELNRKINETLEAMAQALFKSWFVDFDPVIDNALAEGNEIPEVLKAKVDKRKAVKESGQYKALPKDIQVLFPASFVFNEELGKWIPEGWDSCSLNEISDISTGFPFKSKEYGQEKGVKVVRGENVSLGFLRWNTLKTWEGKVGNLEKYWLKERDIVIGMDGSRIGRNRTYIPKYELPMLLAQRVACVRPKNNYGASFVGQIVLSDYFERYVELVKTGTSIPHISLKQIKELLVIRPNNDLALKYSTLTDSFLEKTFDNNNKNRSLSKCRDLLLSQLISGKTRLPASFIQQFESTEKAVS